MEPLEWFRVQGTEENRTGAIFEVLRLVECDRELGGIPGDSGSWLKFKAVEEVL